MIRRILLFVVLASLATGSALYVVGRGWFGTRDGAGEITGARRPEAVQENARARQAEAARALPAGPAAKQILFGDLHVHTSISFDAFMISLPSISGEGAHPPADACDFARYCSALDFWSINDHAETISSEAWRDTIESLRACEQRSGDPENPDLVSFLGWEWTQVGDHPGNHYGHKNVVLRGLSAGEIPTRPIASGGRALAIRSDPPGVFSRGYMALATGVSRMHDFARYWAERENFERCADGVDTRELPADCVEVADTPEALFRKLDQWGFDSLVIPHGTTWGFYTPPTSSWDKQLASHDPARQRLFEIYSGHGASEVYRSFRGLGFNDEGEVYCPSPTDTYLPSCWRAGEIIFERCLDEGAGIAACEQRAARTRELAAQAGLQAHITVPGARPEEWLDAGQCRDCDLPAFNYRPGGSAQYILALGNFEQDPAQPRRFRMGFMGSSDNHFARPGTGYKEKNRVGNTESNYDTSAPVTGAVAFFRRPPEAPSSMPRAFDPESDDFSGFQMLELERQASFFMTGGLIAAHAEGRSRDAIWESMQRREVYATSGPRLLLWFDLVNAPEGAVPMGGEAVMREAPIFEVRAAGSFEQLPGCPDYASDALSPETLARLCKGECYNPSGRRRDLSHIEIVRVRPQVRSDEDVSELIEDPWRSYDCKDASGKASTTCTARFVDEEFTRSGRDTVYYVRVYEEEAPGINAGNVNCEYNADDECVAVSLCDGDAQEDCLAPHEPRAWSSPIYIDFGGPEGRSKEDRLVRNSER